MLRLYDGFAHTSPDLRGAVRELQAVLRQHDRAVAIDGLFDRGTEQAVRAFQRAQGLPTDGVVGPATWQALLEPEPPAAPDRLTTQLSRSTIRCCSTTSHAAARYGALDRGRRGGRSASRRR